MELKIVEIKLKIVRGRSGPGEKRFEYSTLIEYIIGEDEEKKVLTMGIIPPTYFYLKQVLREELDDLERVVLHNIQRDYRKIIRELFIENNLLHVNLEKTLAESVDRVVIDHLKPIGKTNYNFSASIYLNNGQRIPEVIPSDAAVIALIANKNIYVTNGLLAEKERIDQEIDERLASEKEKAKKPEETEAPKTIYT